MAQLTVTEMDPSDAMATVQTFGGPKFYKLLTLREVRSRFPIERLSNGDEVIVLGDPNNKGSSLTASLSAWADREPDTTHLLVQVTWVDPTQVGSRAPQSQSTKP